MLRPIVAFLCLALVGLTFAGCSKCGWLWEEGGRACHADAPLTR